MVYGYDGYGRRTSMTDPDGNETEYTYNSSATNKRLSGVEHALLGVSGYAYRTSDGLLESVTHSNQVLNNYSYDTLKRLSGIDVYSADFGETWHDEDYTYNAGSVRTGIDVTGNGISAWRMEYKYDSLLRLTDEYKFTGSTQNWGRKYGFDAAGNRTSLAKHDGSTTISGSGFTHNDWNQLTHDSSYGRPARSGYGAITEPLWMSSMKRTLDENTTTTARTAGKMKGHP